MSTVEWKAVDSPEGTYYWNVITDEVVWERPQGVAIEGYNPEEPVIVSTIATSTYSLGQLGMSQNGFTTPNSLASSRGAQTQQSTQGIQLPAPIASQNGGNNSFQPPSTVNSQRPTMNGADRELNPKPADNSGSRTVQLDTGNTVLDPKSVFNRTAGAHTSIGLPSGVIKNVMPLQYEDFANHSWQSMKTDTTTKAGFLNKLAGINWTRYWFVLKGANLLWFRNQGESFAVGDIPLAGLNAAPDRVVKKPYVFNIHEGNTNHLIACRDEQEMLEWISLINQACQNAKLAQGAQSSFAQGLGINTTASQNGKANLIPIGQAQQMMRSGTNLPPPIAQDPNALPEGWQECSTETGDIYYWNSITDESTWTRPVGPPPVTTQSFGGQATTFSAPAATPSGPALGVMGSAVRRPDERAMLYNKMENAHQSVSLPSGFTKMTGQDKATGERKLNKDEAYAAIDPRTRLEEKRKRQEMIEKEISQTDLVTCYLTMQVVKPLKGKSERQFQITITFNTQEWQIFRIDRDIKKLHNQLTGAKHVVPQLDEYFPKDARKLEDADAAIQYQGFFDHILRHRNVIIPEKKTRYWFLEFLAPSRLADKTPKDFFLPFLLQPP